MALNIVSEMEEKGIKPDLVTYTTVINCFRRGRKLAKCWEIHRNLTRNKEEFDEAYIGVMMKVYAAVFCLSYVDSRCRNINQVIQRKHHRKRDKTNALNNKCIPEGTI